MEKHCEVCGNIFQGQRSTARYCGNTCKVAAYRRRQAAKLEIESIVELQERQRLLQKLRAVLPRTAAAAEKTIAAAGWDCAELVIKLCLEAFTESREVA